MGGSSSGSRCFGGDACRPARYIRTTAARLTCGSSRAPSAGRTDERVRRQARPRLRDPADLGPLASAHDDRCPTDPPVR
jgi:hypothetical protein